MIGVPPRQKCEMTMAAVSEARLATMRVCGDSLLPPPPPCRARLGRDERAMAFATPPFTGKGESYCRRTDVLRTFDPAPS